jgi:membrane protease YdiL (CAAX protease family)
VEPGPPATRSVPVAILFSVAAAIAVFALSLPLALAFGVRPPLSEPLTARDFVAIALATDVAFVAVALAVLRAARSAVPLAFPRRWVRPTAVSLVGVALVNGLGTAVLSWAGEPYTGVPDLQADAWGAIASLVAIVAAPLSEELFFREALLVRILRGAPRALAIAVSSVLFGLLHAGSGGWILVVTLTFMGAILADSRLRTGSLGPPVALHALNNGIAVLLVFLAGP